MFVLKWIALCVVLVTSVVAAPLGSRRDQITKLVVAIQRADYEGDRPALKRLYTDLEPFVDDKKLGAKVRYWRGFALWRRAINGSNEKVDATELEQDLKQAVSEFEAAMLKEPAFVDAKASAGATLGRLMFLYVRNPTIAGEFKDPARMRESVNRALSYMKEAEAAEPENPRVLCVMGPVRSYLSQQRGEGPDKVLDAAMESYQKGLKAARARKSDVRDPLIPSWGEPECLMSLAGMAAIPTRRPTDHQIFLPCQFLSLLPFSYRLTLVYFFGRLLYPARQWQFLHTILFNSRPQN